MVRDCALWPRLCTLTAHSGCGHALPRCAPTMHSGNVLPPRTPAVPLHPCAGAAADAGPARRGHALCHWGTHGCHELANAGEWGQGKDIMPVRSHASEHSCFHTCTPKQCLYQGMHLGVCLLMMRVFWRCILPVPRSL